MKNRDTRNLIHTTTPIQTGNNSALAANDLPDGSGFFAIKDGVLRWYRRYQRKTYYVDFKKSGKEQERIYWEDLRFPAQAINPTGAGSDADRDTSGVFIGTLLFSGTSNESIFGVAQMPHSWREGSSIRPHIHWSPTNDMASNKAVKWQLSYSIADIGDEFSETPDTVSVVIDGAIDENIHTISSFDEIDMSGYKISCCIFWALERRATDVADDYTSDARLWEFDIHYQVDRPGSELELRKLRL